MKIRKTIMKIDNPTEFLSGNAFLVVKTLRKLTKDVFVAHGEYENLFIETKIIEGHSTQDGTWTNAELEVSLVGEREKTKTDEDKENKVEIKHNSKKNILK